MSALGLADALVPGGGRRSLRLVERNLVAFRHGGWLVVLSGFFEPLLYLLAMGYGVGTLVGEVTTDSGRLPYARFVAPALMAASAMNGAVYETTFNVFFKLRHARLYETVLSTPLGIVDIALGELGWAVLRGTVYAVGFIVVMAALGLVGSPWFALALPASVLIGVAFGGAGIAATCFVRSWHDFVAVQLVVLPMFLFSATFSPLGAYPAALQVAVACTPLYHAVHLLRALSLGEVDAGMLVDVLYLAALGIAGIAIAAHRMARVLLR